MSSMIPGSLTGSCDAGPAQAMRSFCVRMAALLHTSEPVHNRPILVRSRELMLSCRAWSAAVPTGCSLSCATCHDRALIFGKPATTYSADSEGGHKATGSTGPKYHIGCVTVLHYSMPYQCHGRDRRITPDRPRPRTCRVRPRGLREPARST